MYCRIKLNSFVTIFLSVPVLEIFINWLPAGLTLEIDAPQYL